jgi:hypothetical protein
MECVAWEDEKRNCNRILDGKIEAKRVIITRRRSGNIILK